MKSSTIKAFLAGVGVTILVTRITNHIVSAIVVELVKIAKETTTMKTTHIRSNSFEDVIFATRSEAEEVLTNLLDTISDYGNVSVADFYDMAGIPCNFTDHTCGWTELIGVKPVRIRDGYILNLPDVIDLEVNKTEKEDKIPYFESPIFDTRHEAEGILDKMKETMAKYNELSYFNLRKILGDNSPCIDSNHGWKDISKIEILSAENGYSIELPIAIKLD